VLNQAPRHEGVLGEWRYRSTHSLTPALDGGEWSASRPCRFTPKERAPGTHWIGGWVGPRAVLDAVVKRKRPSPRRESNPRTPIVQCVAQRYTDRAITALLCILIILKSASCFQRPCLTQLKTNIKIKLIIARGGVFTVTIQVSVFWLMTTRGYVVGYQRFGLPCCLHLQGEVNCTDAGTGFIASDSLCRPVWSRHRALSRLMSRFNLHRWDGSCWFVLLHPDLRERDQTGTGVLTVLYDWMGLPVTLIST
jgi:hypothetical protein